MGAVQGKSFDLMNTARRKLEKSTNVLDQLCASHVAASGGAMGPGSAAKAMELMAKITLLARRTAVRETAGAKG